MAPSKIIDRAPPSVVPASVPSLKSSRLPTSLRLPILFVLNLGLQSALWTFANSLLGNELGLVSKTPDEDDFVTPVTRLAYKIGVIWLGWKLNYDFVDISALTAVTNIPFAFLLTTYYNITPLTVATLILNEVVAIAVPTYLLRPRSAVNNPNAPLRNRFLLDSFQVQLANAALAVGVYVVVLFASLKTDYLNTFLVTYFEIPTLDVARNETVFVLGAKLLVAGVATKSFLLNPSIAATPISGETTPVEKFNAAHADLPQTLKHNFWFFNRRTRTLIQQTLILSSFLFANTTGRSLSLSGTEFVGAAGYSSIWIVANVICAAWWVWVGDAAA